MMEFQSKAEIIEHICRTSNTSLKDIYDKISEFGISQLHSGDNYKNMLNDDYLMLSVYQKLSELDSFTFGLFNRLGKFDSLPYVFYDYFETKQEYIKNELPELEKKINARDKELAFQSNQLFRQRIANEENLVKDSKLSIEQQKADNKRHHLYSIYKPIDERVDGDMEHLVIAAGKLKKILERYNQQGYLSLKQVQRELKSDLEAVNKDLYIQAFQTMRHEGIEVSKALLKWIVAPHHIRRGYLYKLDEELANNLIGVGDATIRGSVIKKLNELRDTGAKIWFKINLIDYVLRCQKNAENVSTDGFYLKVEKDKKSQKIDTFDNGTKNKMRQAAIDAAPMKVDIYEVAYKVISENDNHLNDFLTGSGDANAELYNPIKIRTNYTKEQVRYHLKTAINEGIDPHLSGINKKLVDGLLLDLLSDIGFSTKDLNN